MGPGDCLQVAYNCLLNKRAYKVKRIKSFQSFPYFCEVVISAVRSLLKIFLELSSAIWNCLLSLFTLWKRKSIPLLYILMKHFHPKIGEPSVGTAILYPPHFITWICSKYPGPSNKQKMPSKDKNLPSLTSCQRLLGDKFKWKCRSFASGRYPRPQSVLSLSDFLCDPLGL